MGKKMLPVRVKGSHRTALVISLHVHSISLYVSLSSKERANDKDMMGVNGVCGLVLTC